MKYQAAITALNKKHENKFLLKGAEPYLKKNFLIRVKYLYPDYKIFFPDDQEEAFDVIGSGNLFESKAVILMRFDKMDVKQFESLIKNYGDCVVAVLGDKVETKNRAMSKMTTIMKVVECTKLSDYGSGYSLWISSKITSAGYTAPGKVNDMIFARVGPNMSVIASELTKLFLVKIDSKIITENDVLMYVSQTSVSTAFELFEYLMRKDIKKALSCFYSYTRNHTIYIDVIAFLGLYFEKMYRMLLLRDDKTFNEKDIADIIGIPAFIMKTKYLPKARAYGKGWIGNKINEICDLDVKSRLFRGDKRVLMENFILNFK